MKINIEDKYNKIVLNKYINNKNYRIICIFTVTLIIFASYSMFLVYYGMKLQRNQVTAKFQQITHPRTYRKIIKQYADGKAKKR